MAKSVKDLEKDINTLNAQIAELKKSLANAYDPSTIDKFSKSIEKLTASLEKSESAHLKSLQKEEESYENVVYNLQRKAKAQEKALSKDKKVTEEATKLREVIEQIQQLKENDPSEENLKLAKALTKDYSKSLDVYQDMTNEAKELLEIQNASKDAANKFLNDVSKGIGKLPIVGESLSKGFDAFMNSEYANKLKTKIAEKMFDPKAVGKSFEGALGLGLVAAGVTLITAGIKAGLAREQELKDQQRSIGLTNEQSKSVDKMQRGLLFSSKSMVTSMEEARKASAELVDNFGKYGAENATLVDQQVNLTKAYGLQAEEASDFQRSAMISGQSTEEMKIAVLSTAAGFNKTTKSTQSLSGVLRAVSKLSDSIRIQFRGSGQELTAAVMKAKMLGTTLEDLNGIADQLLNIESSIENQVTAQLVTGRNINLDRARFFALTDDMSGLMDELVKQEIDYASYSKMNRVEKQATAAALGMNVDQMAKFVSQQELAKQLNIDMAKAENQTAEGLENSLKSRQEEIHRMAELGNEAAKKYEKDNEALTTQEKMNKLIDIMTTGLKFIAPILIGIGVAATIMGIGLMKAAMAAIALTVGASAGAAAASISTGLVITAGVVGTIMALGSGYMMSGMASGGDVIGGSGPVVVGEDGPEIVRLRKGNSVTPNSQLNTVGNNNAETNDLLRQLIAKVDQPAIIKMGDTTINELGNKTTLNRNYQAEA